MKRYLFLSIGFIFCFNLQSFAQWGSIGDRIVDGLSNKAQQKIESEISNGADRAYEKSKSSVKESVKNSGSKSKNSKSSSSNSNDNNNEDNDGQSNSSASSSKNTSSSSSLKAYGKFDFIPGEKVIAEENFSQDAIGDFPAKWNTNGTGELVTIDGQQGKWLKFGPESIIYPEFVTNLPENFTVEFMLASSQPFSYYSTAFNFFFAPLANPAKNYVNWKRFGGDKKNGVLVALQPEAAGGNAMGQKWINTFDETGDEIIKNQTDFPEFNHENKNVVKISIWRQKQRLRVYVNETKIWDIPKAFSATAKYNFVGFRTDGYHNDNDAYYLSNLRVAIGAPDTRHKFLEIGKYSTTGIKFDVNSDKIKGESYGTLKDFAAVMTENPDVKVKIVGHTDSDGDDASNMTLSKKRADAVKAALNKEFGIDNSRMETEGKGESQPAEPNTSAEGKANNRRVEFIKQ
ncbi:MAG TPA: OmpA family protein [Chitinophagales bacterium]|nr:OmpA family protein [Chitinophagales bacterium]HND82680.1 OmpA family protein [Chitinophagales bacterium]HNG71965.1 OmpA family protein [Chitinophagales bacterium]HNI32087.1 OmpA family protein [Chitinophagales bacterium]HNK11822.1 OmpA family protein [Chitinophagales bacterium]